MIQQINLKFKCQQDDHKDEIDTVCYNQFCTEFRLNCFKCIKKGKIHNDHFDDVEKINTIMDFIENKNIECDNLINDLNKLVESMNQSFSQLKMGIRFKYSLQKERLEHLNSLQINDYLNSTIKLIEYKQSITTIISEQTKKLAHSFNNLYQQLQLSQFNYYQIDDNSIKLSKELYDKGYDLYLGQKYDEAIQILDKSLQYNPNNHLSLWCKGACLRNLNKYEDAITWLDKALAIDTKHVNSLFDKGRLNHNFINRLMFRNLNKYEDAITWLDKALAIDTKHVFSLNEKGKCLRLLKKYNESLQLLDQALLINPQHLFSLQTKGDCLRDQQKYKESLIYYEKSLEIDPNNQYSKNQKEFCQKKLNQ